jgi:hypothetical protein
MRKGKLEDMREANPQFYGASYDFYTGLPHRVKGKGGHNLGCGALCDRVRPTLVPRVPDRKLGTLGTLQDIEPKTAIQGCQPRRPRVPSKSAKKREKSLIMSQKCEGGQECQKKPYRVEGKKKLKKVYFLKILYLTDSKHSLYCAEKDV